jgi:hypothetical protein
MEEQHMLGEDLPLPPARLFERLSQIHGYTWDQSVGLLPLLIYQADMQNRLHLFIALTTTGTYSVFAIQQMERLLMATQAHLHTSVRAVRLRFLFQQRAHRNLRLDLHSAITGAASAMRQAVSRPDTIMKLPGHRS